MPIATTDNTTLHRTARKARLQIILAGFLLLLWLTLGRGLLGSFGWMTFILIVAGPVAAALLLTVLALFIKPVAKTASMGVLNTRDKTFLYLLYASIFLSGCFLVDYADTPASANSVVMLLFGDELQSVSNIGFFIFFLISVNLYVATLIQLYLSNQTAEKRSRAKRSTL